MVLPQLFFLTFVVAGFWARNPWAGYGAAVILLGGVVSSILARIRDGGTASQSLLLTSVLGVALATMYFSAGQALGPARPLRRGLPWLIFACLLALFPLVFQAYVMPTGGMENTLLQGDSVFILRRFASGAPHRGDIVAHRYPLDRRQSFVKRVVAVAGDRVRLRKKKLVVNDRESSEPYVINNSPYEDVFRDNFPQAVEDDLPSNEWANFLRQSAGGEITVPVGKLFVLGDNRDSSLDSRYWGFVDEGDVLGRPVIVYWSVPRRRTTDDSESWLASVRWHRIFHWL
ncbi:MAG: signal peptidase I [Bryobacteraceae bacterium]|nr:signal peptidase I [Bryobacteraceae bacterium]